MNKRPVTKIQRREIRRLAGVAHERELSIAAGELQSAFERWRCGEMDVFDLNEQIHRFHESVSRDLYKFYAMGEPEWSVASAISREIIKESEVDTQVLQTTSMPAKHGSSNAVMGNAEIASD